MSMPDNTDQYTPEIDYAYYEKQARTMRSAAFTGIFTAFRWRISLPEIILPRAAAASPCS